MNWAARDQVPVRSLVLATAIATVASFAPMAQAYSIPLLSSTSSSTVRAGVEATILLTQADASQEGSTSPAPQNVRTQAELISYAAELLRSDPSIVNIELGTDTISMTYKEDKKVLGIGHSSNIRVIVHDDGSVSVRKPWLMGIMTKDGDLAKGFEDIDLKKDDAGLLPLSQALVLTRLQGRFEIGAI